MKKLLLLAALILAVGISPENTFAITKDPSATLDSAFKTRQDLLDVRAKALRKVFDKYNSPLADQEWAFVKYADEFGVDWKLLPAISGLESGFGKFLMPGSYNAYGWGGGYIYFDSWEEGIKVINRALRLNYMNRGAQDVWSIGPIYAESPTWSIRVAGFMEEISTEYLKLTILTIVPTVSSL